MKQLVLTRTEINELYSALAQLDGEDIQVPQMGMMGQMQPTTKVIKKAFKFGKDGKDGGSVRAKIARNMNVLRLPLEQEESLRKELNRRHQEDMKVLKEASNDGVTSKEDIAARQTEAITKYQQAFAKLGEAAVEVHLHELTEAELNLNHNNIPQTALAVLLLRLE